MSKEQVQETQEEIDARLAEEAALSGENFEPTEEEAGESTNSTDNSKADTGKKDSAIDLDVLAAIAGEEKPTTVPHARFNEVNLSKKAAEARVHELELELARLSGKAEASEPKKDEKAQSEPAAYDFDDAEERYAAALLDGESAKAKQIRAEIRAKEQDAADRRAEAAADRLYKTNKAADDAARTKLEFDIELNKAYATFPFLNTDSADKNQDAIDETLVWHTHYMGKGKTAAQALAAAVEKIGPRYAPKADGEADEVVKPPKADLVKALARADKVPPKAEGTGNRAASLNVAKMTSKDIKALAPDEEARLAGDTV